MASKHERFLWGEEFQPLTPTEAVDQLHQLTTGAQAELDQDELALEDTAQQLKQLDAQMTNSDRECYGG